QTGSIWVFVRDQLGNAVTRTDNAWTARPDARLAGDVLPWLNRMQSITTALFPGNRPDPRMRFKLNPLPNSNIQSLVWNGEKFWGGPKDFEWPSDEVRLQVDLTVEASYTFEYSGMWGIFALMADADEHPPGSRRVGLTNLRHGRRSQPTPVR